MIWCFLPNHLSETLYKGKIILILDEIWSIVIQCGPNENIFQKARWLADGMLKHPKNYLLGICMAT